MKTEFGLENFQIVTWKSSLDSDKTQVRWGLKKFDNGLGFYLWVWSFDLISKTIRSLYGFMKLKFGRVEFQKLILT